MQVCVKAATQPSLRVSMKITEVIFVLTRPRRDLRPGSLFSCKRKFAFGQTSINRSKREVRILAHDTTSCRRRNESRLKAGGGLLAPRVSVPVQSICRISGRGRRAFVLVENPFLAASFSHRSFHLRAQQNSLRRGSRCTLRARSIDSFAIGVTQRFNGQSTADCHKKHKRAQE